MLGLGFRIATVASVLVRLPALTGTVPGARLALSAIVNLNVPVPAGTTLLNRTSGSTFTTTIPGIAINDATGAVTGTPTARSGLVTEHFAGGGARNSLLFTPDGGSRTMKLGMNLPVFTYYTPNITWLDYLKASENSSVGGTYDANGMPQTLGSNGQLLYYFPMDDGRTTPFGIRLITDGDMDIVIQSSGGGDSAYGRVQLTRTSDGFTGTWAGAPAGVFNSNLVITAIRTPPTFMALVREDEVAAWRAWKAGTRPHRFKDGFIATVSRFSRLRFLDWNSANLATIPDLTADALSYRNPAGYQNFVPLAVRVELCIAAACDMWDNVHSSTTDAQYQAMFPQYDRLIAAGHKVAKEWANEVWNGSFPQYASSSAKFDTVQGATIDNIYFKPQWYTGYRSAQLAKLARGKGYQWLVGVQPVAQAQAGYVEQGFAYAAGAWSDFYAWTCSGYPAGSWGQHKADIGDAQFTRQQQWVAAADYDAGINDVISNTGPASLSLAYSLNTYWPDAKANATRLGLKLVAYEGSAVSMITGGVYVNNGGADAGLYGGFDAYCVALAHCDLSRGAAETLLLAAQQAGFDEFMYYCLEGETTSALNGVWGALGHPADDGLKDFAAIPLAPSGTTSTPTPTRYLFEFTPGPNGYGNPGDVYYDVASRGIVPMVGGVAQSVSGWSATSNTTDGYARPIARLVDGDDDTAWVSAFGGVIVFTLDSGAGGTARPDSFAVLDCPERHQADMTTMSTVRASKDGGATWTVVATNVTLTYANGVAPLPLTWPS